MGKKAVSSLTQQEKRTRFIELRARGLSYRKIAKELGIATATATAWNRELSAAIREAKKIEVDALLEQYKLGKVSRINQLGGTLSKLETELQKRSLDDVPTYKLVELSLRTREALAVEVGDLETETRTELNNLATSDEAILKAMSEVYRAAAAGEITPERAKGETSVLLASLRAFQVVELTRKISAFQN